MLEIKKEDIDVEKMKAQGWISVQDLPCPDGLVLVVSRWVGEIPQGYDPAYGIYLVSGKDSNGDFSIVGGCVYASWAHDVLFWRVVPTIITK